MRDKFKVGSSIKLLRWFGDIYKDGIEWKVNSISKYEIVLRNKHGYSRVINLQKHKVIVENGLVYECLTRRQFIQDRRLSAELKGKLINSGGLLIMYGNIVENVSRIT